MDVSRETIYPLLPGSYDDLYAWYGDPRKGDFERTHIVSIVWLNRHVRCHKAIAAALRQVDADLIGLSETSLVRSVDGCYAVRPIRGGVNLSLHSWGLAIDINASSFPLGSLKRQDERLIAAFRENHFFWGGDFWSRKDPMHFQYTKPHTI